MRMNPDKNVYNDTGVHIHVLSVLRKGADNDQSGSIHLQSGKYCQGLHSMVTQPILHSK